MIERECASCNSIINPKRCGTLILLRSRGANRMMIKTTKNFNTGSSKGSVK
jgi:hypothetical protein